MPSIDPQAWIRAALTDGSPPTALNDLLADHPELDRDVVLARIAADELHCVWMPGNGEDREPIIPGSQLHLLLN